MLAANERHEGRVRLMVPLPSLRLCQVTTPAGAIAQIARTVSRIAICDREIGRLNATSTSKFGHIRPVLSGAAPAITALFQEGVVWDAFIAVAGLQSLPVAKGKAKVA